MFEISYCQIYPFHLHLNLDKIMIFRSFQQNAEEIHDLSHFRPKPIPFFDRITFNQWKDARTAVLASKKSTSLTELFSVELKFTINSLNNWFRNTIKIKSLELDDIKKQIYVKENPIVSSKIIYCICGFLIDIESPGEAQHWYDFAVEREHLFIINIYSKKELEDIRNICSYREYFDRFIELVLLLEKTIENPRGIIKK